MMKLFNILTVEDFYQYIAVELGAPILKQEVHLLHLEHAVKRAIEYYLENSSMVSSNRQTMSITVTDPNNIIVPDEVKYIIGVHSATSSNARSYLDRIESNLMLYQGNFQLIDILIQEQYISLFENHFSKPTGHTFHKDSRKLEVIPKPLVGDEIIIDCGVDLKWDSLFFLNNWWIRDYATALTFGYWATVTSKYGNPIVQGEVTINSDYFKSEYDTRKEKLEEFLLTRNQGMSVIFG